MGSVEVFLKVDFRSKIQNTYSSVFKATKYLYNNARVEYLYRQLNSII